MWSAVAVRIPNSIASNTSPTTHRIKKITFTFGCLSKIFSDKNLKKSNVKSQTKTSQSHPQSHIFRIIIQILLVRRTCFGFISRCMSIENTYWISGAGLGSNPLFLFSFFKIYSSVNNARFILCIINKACCKIQCVRTCMSHKCVTLECHFTINLAECHF